MQLYTLLYGKSKKRMKPIMVDSLHKCENYRDARTHTVMGWHGIEPAAPDATVWRQDSATVGGNRADGRSGYISKHGFNPHT